MASSAGIDAQIGMAQEVTYGTYVAPTRFYEFVSENLKFNVQRINSEGIRAGRRTMHRWKAGTRSVAGDINFELVPQDLGLILSNILGTPITTGSDPYTHTFTGLTAIDAKSLTIQVGRPDEAGTVQPFSYLGCKFTEVVINASAAEMVKMKASVYGREEVTAQALVAATYDAELEPFVFTEGTLSIAGSVVEVKSCEYKINVNLGIDRFRVGANGGKPKKALINGLADISGTFTADFESLTNYNRYVNGTEASLVLNFDAGTDKKLTITSNVRFDGETPEVGGMELLELTQPFVATGSTDAAVITAVLVNSDVAP
jgi:hypothetical protein